MEFFDLKVEWIFDFLMELVHGQEEGGGSMEITGKLIQGWMIVIALFLISWNWWRGGKKLDAHTMRVQDLNKNIDDLTDALVEKIRSDEDLAASNRELAETMRETYAS